MISSNYSSMNDNLRRTIQGKVELYQGSTLLDTFLATDKLQEITVSRAGEKGKFFGFGICQQATVKVIDNDPDNPLAFIKGEGLKTSFRANSTSAYARVCPTFYIKDAKRDEKTRVITLTAYDAIDAATGHVFGDLGMVAPYTIKNVVEACARLLGLSINISDPAFDLSYENGANFGGDETLRAVLNAIAEATQTIYYVNQNDQLVFKRLDKSGDAVLTIPKKDYFELSTAIPTTITNIMSVTELGENLEGTDHSGVVQYVRDNPFWNNLLGEDLATQLQASIDRISGLTIVPYNLKWRGNFLTEICDKVSIEAKDGSSVITYILDDSFTYNGGFNQIGNWEYNPDSEKTTASHPITLGDRLNQTFARVDKVNKEITLAVTEATQAKEDVAQLKLTTDTISSEVSRVEDLTEVNSTAISSVKQTADALTAGLERVDQKADLNKENTDAELLTLRSQIDVKLDTSSFGIELNEALSQGVDQLSVKNRNFNFGYDGLTISDDNADISTNVDIDGLAVNQRSNEVLKAGAIYDTNGNKTIGVTTANLHARTYLWVGDNSRFEDYRNGTRTGCFWVG